MNRIGIIDLGSNTIRLMVFDINDDGSFKLLDELKESARLGKGISKTNRLNNESMEKAMKIISVFKDFCNIYNVNKIIAVATAAVRNSDNGKEFINTLYEKTGIKFNIIPGKEEAWYDYYSVINTMDINNAFLLDIGGGSMEIIKVKNRKIKEHISIPHGVVTLTEDFLTEDPPKNEEITKLEEFFKKQFKKFDWLIDKDIDTLVGIGGTVRTVAKINRRKNQYPINLMHNYEMNPSDVNNIFELIKNKSLKERKKIPGLSSERSDIILSGLVALKEIMKYAKIAKLKISGNGLREGILYKNILKHDEILNDVCMYSVYNMMKFYKVDERHAKTIQKYALYLFDKLKPIHNCDEECRNLLSISALLHDIGLTVNYYNHNIHSSYIILHNGINGLTHKSILKVALISTMHEGNGYEKIISIYKNFLSQEENEKIYKMGLILRIAEGLDISHLGRVEITSCEIKNKNIILYLKSNNGTTDLEKLSVEKHNDLFHKIFKKNIKVL
ncbi:MAG: exopolyphosphatase [Thermoanaerobacteraceae bacterium]